MEVTIPAAQFRRGGRGGLSVCSTELLATRDVPLIDIVTTSRAERQTRRRIIVAIRKQPRAMLHAPAGRATHQTGHGSASADAAVRPFCPASGVFPVWCRQVMATPAQLHVRASATWFAKG
jgi:hypothetical protein